MAEESTLSNNKRLCECGCGTIIDAFDKWKGEPRRFKRGHHIKQQGNPMWKGGRYRTPTGYIRVQAKWHPRADSKGYVFEHDLVLEQKLGRQLLPNEDTHHINGIKDDNRPENLTNVLHSEHKTLHHRMDMSNRRCIDCNRGVEEVGRAWIHDSEDYTKIRCNRCHKRHKRSKKGK